MPLQFLILVLTLATASLVHSYGAKGRTDEWVELISDIITTDDLLPCKVGFSYELGSEYSVETSKFLRALQNNVWRSYTVIPSTSGEVDEGKVEKFVFARRCSIHIVIGRQEFQRKYLKLVADNFWAGKSQFFIVVSEDGDPRFVLNPDFVASFHHLAVLAAAAQGEVTTHFY